jgi:predicted O-linked N-acetylglucosamine transferase (SPINDLY family)
MVLRMSQATIDQAIQVALTHHHAGRLAEAEAIYRQVLNQAPDNSDALQLLGVLAGQAGNLALAIDLLRRAIAAQPEVAEHHVNLAEFHRRSGAPDRAIASLRRAIALKPGLAQAHDNLGQLLRCLGRLDEAIAAYGCVVSLQGNDAVAHNNLGVALSDAGRLDEAIAALGQAVALDSRYAEAHSNLGVALHAAGCIEESIAACRRALELRPELPEGHNNLGNALREAGQIEEAIAAYRRALELDPDQIVSAHNLIVTLHFDPRVDAQAIRAETVAWSTRFAAPFADEIRPHANDRSPERRLKVGFVSPDFRDHPAGRLVLPLFAHQNHARFEFIAYSDVRARDAGTTEFQRLADAWRDIVGQSDASVAEQVRAEGIDILVDLALHTAGNRLLVFARKPAPVQVSMLGMPSTTGTSTIDYRLTDRFLDPPGTADADYTEASIRLPHSIWCFAPPAEAPAVGPLPAAEKGFVTFGALNQLAKASGPAVRAWAAILQGVPRSRLILQSPPGSFLDPHRAVFQEAGIAPERVEFVAKAPRAEYLKRYLALDVSLDPFPYNGHTTTFDALWMGVPVVTLAGRTGVGRAGASMLSHLGLTDLIAGTPEQYVEIACQWAHDLRRLEPLRGVLRGRIESSPLVDGGQFAAEVEDALRGIWKRWCGR